MVEINVWLQRGAWGHSKDAERHAIGTAYVDGEKKSGNELTDVLPLPNAGRNIWRGVLAGLNGFFAVLAHDGRELVAAVDRVRSVPLFWGRTGDAFFLSDDAEWVRRQVGSLEVDPIAKEEFQLTGYVTGDETLYQGVKQIQAGEMIHVKCTDEGLHIERGRYYRFVHLEPPTYAERALRVKLQGAVERAIQRLITYAGGRQIVLPLSGGYDSRLIALLLSRAGYPNILTFTYGVPGNKESEYSRLVARTLGLPWHFLEYSKEKWQRVWHTHERYAYRRLASQHTSLPHYQDWLAVREMKALGLLEPACVFVPGHSGDFVAGSHIPETAFAETPKDITLLCQTIFERHYSLAPLRHVSSRSISSWWHRIQDRTDVTRVPEAVELADAFERWDWRERQAKYIVNSVRVYEFWDYDWWLPLWDSEFVELWQGVPLALRIRRSWYAAFVREQYAREVERTGGLGRRTAIRHASSEGFGAMVRNLARRVVPSAWYEAARGLAGVREQSHLYAAVDGRYEGVRQRIRQGFRPNGVAAWMFLQEVGTEPEELLG